MTMCATFYAHDTIIYIYTHTYNKCMKSVFYFKFLQMLDLKYNLLALKHNTFKQIRTFFISHLKF